MFFIWQYLQMCSVLSRKFIIFLLTLSLVSYAFSQQTVTHKNIHHFNFSLFCYQRPLYQKSHFCPAQSTADHSSLWIHLPVTIHRIGPYYNPSKEMTPEVANDTAVPLSKCDIKLGPCKTLSFRELNFISSAHAATPTYFLTLNNTLINYFLPLTLYFVRSTLC